MRNNEKWVMKQEYDLDQERDCFYGETEIDIFAADTAPPPAAFKAKLVKFERKMPNNRGFL